jgi:hypothetical protein
MNHNQETHSGLKKQERTNKCSNSNAEERMQEEEQNKG